MSFEQQTSKSTDLAQVISSVHRAIPDLHGVMLASVDGLPIAHSLEQSDAEEMAAMAAAALDIGTRITERTRLGVMAETVIRGEEGYFVVHAAGTNAVLVMWGPIDSSVGLMRIEARAAAVEIKRILSPS